jgi:hypothetical protein
MDDDRLPTTEVLRIAVDEVCPDGRTCPAVIRISSRPGMKALVGKLVTDPAEAAVLGRHIGPGEGVVLVPDELLPEV